MTAIEITAAQQTTLIEVALKEAKDSAKFTTKVSFAMLSANLLMISIVLAALLRVI
jgi:ABC-type transport system involved in cytochrome c biogenesis permease subunit